jgi:hypothetical protein
VKPVGDQFDLVVADFGCDPEFVMHALQPLTDERRKRVLEAAKILSGGGSDSNLDITNPALQKKKRAAAIIREIAARADRLRRDGARNPVTQAEREVAARWQYVSGSALNRWLRRNR